MRTGLWDRHGANIASRYKEMYGLECFSVSPVKSDVFGQRMPHFAVILWETEVTNVGALKLWVFCGINAMKFIDKHSLRMVDCEIYWLVSKYV